MLTAVYDAAAATGLFEVDHIRVRAWPLQEYLLGGARKPFVHVQCRIHAGRDDGQKRRLSEAVLAAIRAQAWPVTVITVEVVELERESYTKAVSG